MASGTPHLPDAVVGFPPSRLEELHQLELQVPRRRHRVDVALPGEVEGVHHLAVDIHLVLVGGRVADPHRAGSLVAVQPVDLVLGEPPLTGRAVHDLEIGRIAGDGPQEPVPPALGFLLVARHHERVEGEGGVPQPAVAVVPVADASELLGQRRRGGGDDAPRRRVGERLEGEQGAPHHVAPSPLVLAGVGPRLPVLLGLLDDVVGVGWAGRRLVRRVRVEHEGHALPFPDREVGHRREVLAPRVDRRPEGHRLWSRSGCEPPVDPPHPRPHPPVVEPDREVHAHLDPASHSFHEPRHLGVLLPDRHAVHEPDRAVVGVELGLEHERVAAVAPAGRPHRPSRSQPPVAVVVPAQELGEAGLRVEAGETQPVDRAVAPDERGGVGVSDDPVVLDALGHQATLPTACCPGRSAGRGQSGRRQGVQPAQAPVPLGLLVTSA